MKKWWQKLSLPALEKELIDKWYACILLCNKNADLYISRMNRDFKMMRVA